MRTGQTRDLLITILSVEDQRLRREPSYSVCAIAIEATAHEANFIDRSLFMLA
jgi:hypothetical protein